MEKTFPELFNDPILEENPYLQSSSRIDDVMSDCKCDLYYIIQAIQTMRRPELDDRIHNLYTDEHIEEIDEFLKAAEKFQHH